MPSNLDKYKTETGGGELFEKIADKALSYAFRRWVRSAALNRSTTITGAGGLLFGLALFVDAFINAMHTGEVHVRDFAEAGGLIAVGISGIFSRSALVKSEDNAAVIDGVAIPKAELVVD